MMTYPETTLASWVRDDLPDLLWPSAIVALYGADGLRRFAELQRIGAEELAHAFEAEDSTFALDGRCTSLSGLRPELQVEGRTVLEPAIRERELMPPLLASTLRLYPEIPGSWLLLEPWTDLGDDVGSDDALQLIVRAIVAVCSADV